MTTTARDLLNAFDALEPAAKQEVVIEILRRSVGVGDLPEESLDEMAADLFQRYDAEKTTRADN